MSYLDNLLNVGKNLGSQIGNALSNTRDQTFVSAKNSAKRSSIEMEIGMLEQDLNLAYTSIGRIYVEHLIATRTAPTIPIKETLVQVLTKMKQKKILEEELAELELQDQTQMLMAEKMKYEQEFLEKRTKLEKALSLGLISEEEFSEKINQNRVRLQNFEAIKKIELQHKFGVIDEDEKTAKLKKLGL